MCWHRRPACRRRRRRSALAAATAAHLTPPLITSHRRRACRGTSPGWISWSQRNDTGGMIKSHAIFAYRSGTATGANTTNAYMPS